MAHIYEIASYLEAVLIIKGYEVIRQSDFEPGSVIICILKNKEIIATLMINGNNPNEFYDLDNFYLILSMDDAEGFLEKFDSINS